MQGWLFVQTAPGTIVDVSYDIDMKSFYRAIL